MVGGAVDSIASDGTLAFLAHAGLSVEQLRARLKDFQALPPMHPVADRINVSERCTVLDTFQMLRRDPGEGKLTPEELKMWAALDWDAVFKNADAVFDHYTAALRLPTRAERVAACEKIGAELEARIEKKPPPKIAGVFARPKSGNEVVKSLGDILLALYVSALGRIVDAADRAEQVHRNVVVAFALAAYHRSEGRYPVTLDVLAPRFVAAVPADVFTGRPPVYRREGAGYVLFSVGTDGKGDDRLRVTMPPE